MLQWMFMKFYVNNTPTQKRLHFQNIFWVFDELY